MIPVALTIAGSDSGGGAGIQADLKTFHQLGLYGCSAVTLITVQNTLGVTRIDLLPATLVKEQILAVVSDLAPAAAKTGALGNSRIIEAVAAAGLGCPLVVDPVMISKHGASLMDDEACGALTSLLFPLAALVTPNLHEAEALTGRKVTNAEQMREAALQLKKLGARSVLVKGGHLEGAAVDILLHEDTFTEFSAPRIETQHTHGTGCTYSAAITAFVASGAPLPEAVRRAKQFIHEAIRTNPGLGHGQGPVNHWANPGE